MKFEFSDDVKKLIDTKAYIGTKHFVEQTTVRDFKDIDTYAALTSAEIIEQTLCYGGMEHYLLHCEQKEKTFHIKIAFNKGTLVLVTIYTPDSYHFKKDKKTRINFKPKQTR